MTMIKKKQFFSGGVYEAPTVAVILLQEQQMICNSLTDDLLDIPEEDAGIDDWDVII